MRTMRELTTDASAPFPGDGEIVLDEDLGVAVRLRVWPADDGAESIPVICSGCRYLPVGCPRREAGGPTRVLCSGRTPSGELAVVGHWEEVDPLELAFREALEEGGGP